MDWGELKNLEGTFAGNREQEFYWLWIFATLGYGVGDMLSTIALIGYNPYVKEGNVLVKFLFHQWGLPGFVGGKLIVFMGCLLLSIYALNVWEDRFLYYLPPLWLMISGGAITGYNLWLLSIT